jgi:hypothetical protein
VILDFLCKKSNPRWTNSQLPLEVESGFILDIGYILATNKNRPSRGLIERAEDIQERTFSAATRPRGR